MKLETIESLRVDCELMILEGLKLLLDRYEKAVDYPFVDMKLKVITGKEFPQSTPGHRSIYDRDVIYGVIQGRAIESLAGHIRWLPSSSMTDRDECESLRGRALQALRQVVDSLEALRDSCGGRMYFMMSSEGGALRVTDEGTVEPWEPSAGPTDTDIFYAKGLMAAAHCLGDSALLAEGSKMFLSAARLAACGALINDRQPMDPKNLVRPVPGRITHGPKMLSLGGVATAIALQLGSAYWHLGAQLIREIVAVHINTGQFTELEYGDFVEFVDPAG